MTYEEIDERYHEAALAEDTARAAWEDGGAADADRSGPAGEDDEEGADQE